MNLSFPILAAPNFGELVSRWAAIPDSHSGNATQMLALVQRARTVWGGPITVTSWYRSPVSNLVAGGASGSQHLTASAMDLKAANGDTLGLFNALRTALPASSFGQLIFERTHVHLSLPNRASGVTGEVLTEPKEGTYVVVPGVAQRDDTREGYANPTTLATVVVLGFLLWALFSGVR